MRRWITFQLSILVSGSLFAQTDSSISDDHDFPWRWLLVTALVVIISGYTIYKAIKKH